MEKEIIMSITSEPFADLRWSFDRVLAAVLKKMEIRDSDSADITLKVKIRFDHVKTMDSSTGEMIEARNPSIQYKVNHKLEYKSNEDSEEGTFQRADSYLALVDGQWTIRPIEDNQMKIEDYMEGPDE